MIRKINNITSIGKYRNYTASGQVDFNKLTTIFGDNGSGKTTLTSILRSLSKNNIELIKSRKSTNNSANQSCQIIERSGGRDNFYTYHHSNGWSANLPEMEIFDVHFIHENIYSGFEFNEEHKKHLHEFVIGAQGVAIKQQIEQNKIDKSNSRQTQQQIKQDLITQVGNGLNNDNFSDFVSIPQTHSQNIDSQINLAQTKLATANAQSVINSLSLPRSISAFSPNYDFNTLNQDLQTTVQTIQNETLESIFSEHCSHLEENDLVSPEIWLKTGFNHTQKQKEEKDQGNIENLSCPYCKQEYNEALDIISSYTQKFNQEFKVLSERTANHLQSLQNLNIDLFEQQTEQLKLNNTSHISSWITHLPQGTVSPELDLTDILIRIKESQASLIEDISNALKDPTKPIDISNSQNLESLLVELNQKIKTYNGQIQNLNGSIVSFKQGIASVSLAQNELNNLIRIKKRFETPVLTLITQLQQEKQNLQGLTQAYSTLIQQQESTANTFFSTYCTKINYYLDNVFKTQFQIVDVVNIAPQGRSSQSKIGYTLTFDNQVLSLQQQGQFSVKQCLSEGDKSTIALAFFLAKLDIDPNSSNKILIFDDPLSSLDTKRRGYTIKVIRDYVGNMKQVIVLSHVEHFLYEIQRNISPSDKSNLQIHENFQTRDSSIKECNLAEIVKNEYFKNIDSLINFRSNPNHAIKESVLGWLRNVLEAHLKFKFYKDLQSLSGLHMFGRIITHLENCGAVFKDNADRQNIVSTLKLINDMSWKAHHGTPQPNFSTLGINPNSITPSELDNLIVDTLNLIENKL